MSIAPHLKVLVCFALTALACHSGPVTETPLAGDLGDTEAVSWRRLASGVYVAEVGDVAGITRYTDLAAAPPRLEAINKLPDVPLGDGPRGARYHVHSDGMLSVRIPTEPGEQIFGYGLQFDRTLHSGRILELKVDHFKKGGGKTHAPVPFFISSRGYGVLFNTAQYLKVHNQVGNRRDSDRNPAEVDRNPPPDEPQPGPWLAKPPGDAVEAILRSKGLELVAFSGTDLLDIVSRYNLFSGGGAMPPLWGLGFWHRTPSKFSAEEVEAEVAQFVENDIPLDVIGLEPGWQTKSYPCTFEWQPKRFPDPRAFTQGLLDQGIQVNLWVNPYISKAASIHAAMAPLSGSHMVWLGIVPDYTLAAARRVLLQQHQRDHIDIGISGYKVDEVDGYDHWLWPDHATFPSGTSAEVMRQTYGMLVQSVLHEGLFEAGDRRTYSLVRATNGAASAYPFVIYSDSYGHDEYVTGLSSASLAGVLWCPEIRSARSEREWINRMHTVCLSPLAQLNAWFHGTKPWSYPEATDAVRRTIQLRMRLLPYLYTAFARYHLDGVPPVRSLILETGRANADVVRVEGRIDEANPYGDGFRSVVTEDNSLFMFGPDILVAPFLDEQTERSVNLPEGRWYDFYDGSFVGAGGTRIVVTAEQTDDMPPLYVRDGALVPMLAESVNRTRDVRGAAIEVRRYGSALAFGELYEDDTTTFGYTRGDYRLRELTLGADAGLQERVVGGEGKSLYGDLTLRTMGATQNSAR